MNQEIIQDFLKIPGVLGVALIHGQALPYFHVKEQILKWHEKQALAQNIRQTIVKAPEEVEFFEFQALGYYAYTYKLNSNSSLLVLTDADITANKLRVLAAKQLKAALQKDIDKTITTFKLLTRKIPQAGAVSTAGNGESYALGDNSSNTLLKVKVTIEEILKALNHLSQFSSNYMGPQLTANYWQLTRPNFDWLDNFQINRSAGIAFSGVITEPVSTLQHQWVKEWTAAFIKQSSQIIQDLPAMIEQKGLDEPNKRLLLTPPID